MKSLKTIAISLAFATTFFACKKDNDDPKKPVDTSTSGAFILCEGLGGATPISGDLSFFNFDSNQVQNNIFLTANNRDLGATPSFLMLHGSHAYVVVNGLAKIEKLNAQNFLSESVITNNLISPRQMIKINENKAYISDIGKEGLHVFDLNTDQIIGHISTGKSIEAMVLHEGKVFAGNWANWYVNAPNNTIQVIDVNTQTLIDSIVVTEEPEAMVLDANNKLWVLSTAGYLNPDSMPVLTKINTSTLQIEQTFKLPAKTMFALLAIDGNGQTLYYACNGSVYSMSITSASLPATPLIDISTISAYGIAVNPKNGDIYISDAKDYTQNGQVFVYSSTGILKKTMDVGIVPSKVFFK